MKNFKLSMLLFVTSLSIYLLSGCSNEEIQNKKIYFSTSRNIWCSLGLIANEKNYFKEEGLDVEVKYLDAGRYCLDALVSKSVDFATIVEVNIAYYGYTGDKSVEIIASLVNATASGIVARKSSGIHSPEDLKGKKLALSPGTTSDIYANWFLEKHGMTASDVNLVKIQPQAVVGAVTSGSVDAASTWDPHIYNIKKILGDDILDFRAPEVYTGYLNLAIRKDWGKENAATVESFLKALKKAEKFVQENTAEAQEIISRVINLDKDIVEGTWKYHNMDLKLNKEEMLNAITKIGAWAHTSMDGYNDKQLPDYSSYVNDEYLKNIIKR